MVQFTQDQPLTTDPTTLALNNRNNAVFIRLGINTVELSFGILEGQKFNRRPQAHLAFRSQGNGMDTESRIRYKQYRGLVPFFLG